MKSLRLAVLTDALYPFRHGGKETLQYERAIRLAQRGHSLRVYTMHWWREPEVEVVREGIALHAICPRIPLYNAAGGRSILEAIVIGLASLRLLWAPDFDVLDVDQFPFTPFFAARLVCRLRGRPMTATWYEVWDRQYWRGYMGWLGPLGFWLQRFAARSANLVFADSALTAQRLTVWLGVDPQRVRILSPGTTVEHSPRAGGYPDKMIDCIFIGRLLRHKHVDLFLRALALLPGVTGLILGSGPEADRLTRLASDLGLTDRVHFEAPDAKEAVLRRLRASRLLVFPSTREGFGMAVLDANACGVPALVVRHPDNAALELVRHSENGLICEPRAEAMAAEIRRYLDDEAAQLAMGAAARRRAAAYSWDSYVDGMEAILGELATARGKIPHSASGERQQRSSPLEEDRGGGTDRAA